MLKLILKTAGGALLLASFLFGQTTTTPTPPTIAEIVAAEVAHLTTLLDLTTAQQTQATTIFTTQQTALAALQTPMQTAQTGLTTAITTNSATGIAAAAIQIGSLTEQQVTAQATGEAAFYAILTADQQAKYTELHFGKGGPGGGPDGPGGPGPGGPPPSH